MPQRDSSYEITPTYMQENAGHERLADHMLELRLVSLDEFAIARPDLKDKLESLSHNV